MSKDPPNAPTPKLPRYTCDLSPSHNRMVKIFCAERDHDEATFFHACMQLLCEDAPAETSSFAAAVVDRAELIYAAGRAPTPTAKRAAGLTRATRPQRYAVARDPAERKRLRLFLAYHAHYVSDVFRACIELATEDDGFAQEISERMDLIKRSEP